MNDFNIVTLISRIVKDAELTYTKSGTALCKFAIASNSYQGKDKDDYVSFFDIVLWGKQGEALNPYLKRGQQVGVAGSLRQDRWETDGNKRSRVNIVANNIQLLGGKKDSNNQKENKPFDPNKAFHTNKSNDNQGEKDMFEDDISF